MGEATIVDEFIADGTAGPPAAQKGLIAIEPLVANLTVPRLNPQQHRLPISASFSDAHRAGSIAKRSAEIQANALRKPFIRHLERNRPILLQGLLRGIKQRLPLQEKIGRIIFEPLLVFPEQALRVGIQAFTWLLVGHAATPFRRRR